MGTRMAPSYANLFMAFLEHKLLQSWPRKPLVWLRYIDDIFIIWTHGIDDLQKFISHANTFHQYIKFTSSISSDQIPFLDVLIKLKDGILHTDLYTKPTDTFNYLHWSSCHPYHTKRSIPYSLAFRLIRICSSETTLSIRLNELTKHLRSRGFPSQQIQSAINKAKTTPRENALKKVCREQKPYRVPFVFTYHPLLKTVPSIIRKLFPILNNSERCRKAIPEIPMAAHRRPKNLRDTLVHARVAIGYSSPDFFPCDSARCKTCKHTEKTTTFTSTSTGITYDIIQRLTCTSYNIIYLITCTLCNKQYIGQTKNTLRERLNSHRFDIKNAKDTPLARHFNLQHHTIEHLKVVAIEYLPASNVFKRENKETFWMYRLNTTTKSGINTDRQEQYPIYTFSTVRS